MYVRNERQARTRPDGGQGRNGCLVRHSHAHGLATARLKPRNLRKRCLGIAGVCIGHALHHNRRTAANGKPAQTDGAGRVLLHASLTKTSGATAKSRSVP